MRTHNHTIIDIYSLTYDSNKEEKKILEFENIQAKFETKDFSSVNEMGIRTFEKGVLIYIERRELKRWNISDFEEKILMIHRKESRGESTNEWYKVEAPKSLEAGNRTIVYKAYRLAKATDTNNFQNFGIFS